jgi:hypothetical protein
MILLKPNLESNNLKIDKLPISGFLSQGNERVGSPWPWIVESSVFFLGDTSYKVQVQYQ